MRLFVGQLNKTSVRSSMLLRLFFYAATLVGLFAASSKTVFAQETIASDSLSKPLYRASLLVAPGTEDEIYTIYGHAALRITQEGNPNEDWAYNYGVFDFDAPNFTSKFIAGNTTDYMLAKQETRDYMSAYVGRGSNLYELKLNLSDEEVERLINALEVNLLPENRYYLYNIVFDNCATRPIVVLEKAIEGKLQLPEVPLISVRDMIDQSSTQRPWLKFGTDLALGSEADRPIGAAVQLFLPLYLLDIMRQAEIVEPDGSTRPAVLEEVVYQGQGEPVAFSKTPFLLTPLSMGIFLLVITAFVCFLSTSCSLGYKLWATLFYLSAGIAGCILFYLTFFSLHPLVSPNWNLLALHPFHLFISIPLVWIRRTRLGSIYHLLNIAAQVAFLLVIPWAVVQEIHVVTYLISASVALLSLRYVSPFLLSPSQKNLWKKQKV